MCWEHCRAGYHDDGLTCRKDAHIISADNSHCPGYDKCGLTLKKGCSKCPAGYHNDGCTCRMNVDIYGKSSHARGVRRFTEHSADARPHVHRAPDDGCDPHARGDWGVLTLVYETEPQHEKIVSVTHWAHGYEMIFDMTSPWMSPTPTSTSTSRELRGEQYSTDYFNLAMLGDKANFIANRPDWAQHNLVRFAQDPVTKQFTHPIAYVEFGSHEFFPSEHWGVQFAPKHGGDSRHSYLAAQVPNLGEVHAPLGGDAEHAVVQFSGWWGAENKDNANPPGPPLHKAWMFPTSLPDARRIANAVTCDKRE